MKILYVLNSSKHGGMEVHVEDLVKGMVGRGHEVFVWCPAGPKMDSYKNLGAVGVEQKIRLDIDPFYILKLKKFIEEKSIDVVHSHELKAVTNALLAGHFSKVKANISHTHTPISEWQINPLKKFLNIKFYSCMVNKYSTAEIALTESKKKAKMDEGIREEKLVIIPNGLDTSEFIVSEIQRVEYEKEIKKRFDIPERAYVFGNISRVTKEKDHETLVRAFKRFLDTQLFHKENYVLLIAGGGALEDKIKRLVKELDLEKNVIITGRFDDEDKIKFLSTFDSFVFPTLAEGFGIVLIEALYMGLPTICSDLDVLREVGDDFVTFFEPGNEEQLAEKMIDEYNRTGGEGKFLIEGAKEYVEENYSMDAFINKYEKFYMKLTEENK
jgi:glycosyltransferase EpsF